MLQCRDHGHGDEALVHLCNAQAHHNPSQTSSKLSRIITLIMIIEWRLILGGVVWEWRRWVEIRLGAEREELSCRRWNVEGAFFNPLRMYPYSAVFWRHHCLDSTRA